MDRANLRPRLGGVGAMIGRLSQLAALAAAAVLAGLASFQLLLVAGRPLGEYAWGGAHRILPRGFRIASAVATLIYAGAALVILETAGLIDIVPPSELPRTAVRVFAGFFAIGVAMNAISRSRKERVMALAAVVLAALFAVVGWDLA